MWSVGSLIDRGSSNTLFTETGITDISYINTLLKDTYEQWRNGLNSTTITPAQAQGVLLNNKPLRSTRLRTTGLTLYLDQCINSQGRY
jgi:hypothetical protein